MLCGSTEHLLQKARSAGRMGSGTRWLYELIRELDDADARGATDFSEEILLINSLSRSNSPEQIVQWVFSVIVRHHPPRQRARLQGMARVDLVVHQGGIDSSRLVVATPLYLHDATARSLRWRARRRVHRDLCLRHGRTRGRVNLPLQDRHKVYEPR
jgi:hypothetical protein